MQAATHSGSETASSRAALPDAAGAAAARGVGAPLRRVSVFCGAHLGRSAAPSMAAQALGTLLARAGIAVVYGGAHVGCMGVLADAALAAGGEVIGVMPRQLVALERAHAGLTALHVVADMHARKARMAELADACVVLPGGIGTLDEFFELWTWSYLGRFRGAIGICDTEGYYTPLLAFLDSQVAAGFLPRAHRRTLCAAPTPGELLPLLQGYRYRAAGKIAPAAARRRAAAP